MTRHFIGLPGFLNRLPLRPPDGEDADAYARRLGGELRSGQPVEVRVMLTGHQVDLHLNPVALVWWYLAEEEELPAGEIDARWPLPPA